MNPIWSGLLGCAISSTLARLQVEGRWSAWYRRRRGCGFVWATTVQDENMPLMPRVVDKKGRAGPEPEEPEKVSSPCIRKRMLKTIIDKEETRWVCIAYKLFVRSFVLRHRGVVLAG